MYPIFGIDITVIVLLMVVALGIASLYLFRENYKAIQNLRDDLEWEVEYLEERIDRFSDRVEE